MIDPMMGDAVRVTVTDAELIAIHGKAGAGRWELAVVEPSGSRLVFSVPMCTAVDVAVLPPVVLPGDVWVSEGGEQLFAIGCWDEARHLRYTRLLWENGNGGTYYTPEEALADFGRLTRAYTRPHQADPDDPWTDAPAPNPYVDEAPPIAAETAAELGTGQLPAPYRPPVIEPTQILRPVPAAEPVVYHIPGGAR